MKLSSWLREYQLTGKVPEKEAVDATQTAMAFWAGWLMGCSKIATTMDERREMAIKAAEFIEAQR